MDVFDKETAFWFPVNDEQEGDSVTTYRLTFKKGTPVQEARAVVNEFLMYLGYDPDVILKAMEFDELLGDENDKAKECSRGSSSTH